MSICIEIEAPTSSSHINLRITSSGSQKTTKHGVSPEMPIKTAVRVCVEEHLREVSREVAKEWLRY